MPLKLVPPRQGKTPYWSVRGTHHGVYVNRTTKATSRVTANRFRKEWENEIERGCFAKPTEPTFLDAATDYLATGADDRFIDPIVDRIGDKLAREIDQKMIDDLAISLYPKATPATRNRQLYTPISAVLKHAGFDAKLRRPKGWRGQERTDWLWPDEAFRVFAAAKELDEEFGAFLVTLCYTGMRLSEATVHFHIERLSLNDSYAYVPHTKNGVPRAVFLPPVVLAALANHPRGLERPGETVFRFRKSGRLYALLRAVEKRSGRTLTFHLFRHTYGAWMRRHGRLDTSGLIATGTWKDPASVGRYEHTIASEEAQKAALLPVENLRKGSWNGK